jgi:cytochrome c-type biogenesis protein CcmH
MIRAMADPGSTRIATIVLGAAGLIAVAAVGIAALRPSDTSEAPAAEADAQQPAAEDSAAELLERVRRNPDDHQGWFELGLAYRAAERFAEGERAFRRAMELSPGNADYAGYVGEMLVLTGGREPPPEAEAMFRRALRLQPGHPQARYYLATLRDFRGDHRGALDELIALLRDAPAGAPWEAQVRGAAETIAERNRIDIAGRLPPPRPRAPDATATAGIPGPSREQLDAARSLPPGQQNEMARGMVDRLAARLRQNPRDAEGWIMLMRSRMMLNEPQAAAEALRSALAAFPGDEAARERLRAAAATLAVPSP